VRALPLAYLAQKHAVDVVSLPLDFNMPRMHAQLNLPEFPGPVF
jgi:hypothetical protein